MPPQATADAEGAPEVIWLKYTGARPDKWQHFIAAHCRCNNRERDAARLLEWERRPFRGGCKCEARRDGPRQRQARRNAADGDGRQSGGRFRPAGGGIKPHRGWRPRFLLPGCWLCYQSSEPSLRAAVFFPASTGGCNLHKMRQLPHKEAATQA